MATRKAAGEPESTYVALLRGINVGGNRKVSMADLRECLAALGFTDVRTYLQSGNAVFRSMRVEVADLAVRIEGALAQRFGFDIPTVVLPATELTAVVTANPYPELVDQPTRLVVSFTPVAVPAALARSLDLSDFPERGQVIGRALYLDYPNGQARTKLTPAVLQRRLGGGWGTARNWRTVLALAALAEAEG